MPDAQLESVDYTGMPVHIGQTVTFIENDQSHRGQPRLYSGAIKLIGEEQLVVESGGRLFIVKGRETSHPRAYWFDSVMGMPVTPGTAQPDSGSPA